MFKSIPERIKIILNKALKKTLILLTIIIGSKLTLGQNYSAAILKDADTMLTAFLKGDVDGLLDYTYPPLFDIVGNREFMAEFIATTIIAMQTDGFKIDTALVNEPGPVYKSGNELHAILTQTIYSSFADGTVRSDSPLLAISQDGGNRWYFLDLKQFNSEMMHEIFPNFNYDLKLPPIPPPVVTYRNGVKEK